MLSHAVKQKWGSATDVWEHIAAARELAAHPFHPQHPMLPVDAPHQFFTPYTLFVAMMMKITGWHVLTAFGTVGILNLGLVLLGLHRFVRALGGGTDVAFYTLLFTLFLWGSDAWFYSGFLHFNVIAHVLSYPSTFALGLTLLVFTVQARFLENGDPRLLMGIIAAGVVVLLSHPITFIFFAIGCLSLIGLRSTRRQHALVATLLALMAVGALALIWPYFSIYDLLFGGSPMVEGAYREAVAAANHELYNQVLHRILPALLVVPFVVTRLRDWRRDPLALMAAGLAALYGLGWAYDVGSSGRSLSFLLLVGVMILAQELVKAQHALAELGSSVSPVRRWIRATVALFVLIGMFNLRNGFEVLPDRFVADMPYEWIHNEIGFTRFEDFQFVEHNHARYRVVLSDLYTSLEVPAFGSRTVAFARAQPFVDTRARSADLDRFFAEDTSETERRAIIDRYRVGLLILTREHLEAEPDVYEPMLDLGREVAANDRFVFVHVRSAPGR
jgi:hypothetical protein